MTTSGKLELTIKISELPNARTIEHNWQAFEVDCERAIVSVTVKPKVWKKLEDAQANVPLWVAAITGTMGVATEQGFVLDKANVQVFEKKPKEPAVAG